MTDGRATADATAARPKRPRGAVREGLIAAGLELARTGGPDAVVLREATRIVGVVPNAAYRHFADRDALLAAVCYAAMNQLGDRMAAEVARVRGEYGDPDAAAHRLRAIGTAYLRFAHEEPGLFATAHALPGQHTYNAAPNANADNAEPDRTPKAQLGAALDELVDAGVLDPHSRAGIEFPIWSTVHGLAVLTGEGPLREISDAELQDLENLTLDFIGNSIAFLSGGAEP
ncbi:MAG: TetR/AcrR family transcriptional regulator [Catenulisporales bacterium]|jgi:AcrR family transcriptional regulator|nr:TetR/AcrR family transcriptional regulator [Catenulisporales bacterium]